MSTAEHVRNTANKLARKYGLINLSVDSLSDAAGIPPGSLTNVIGCTFGELIAEMSVADEYIKPTAKPVTKARANPQLRQDQILNAAIEIARKVGCGQITREGVAKKAGVSMGLVSHYFNTMKQLRRAVMRAAINQEVTEIVAIGLVNNDPHARKAPPELRQRAMEQLHASQR